MFKSGFCFSLFSGVVLVWFWCPLGVKVFLCFAELLLNFCRCFDVLLLNFCWTFAPFLPYVYHTFCGAVLIWFWCGCAWIFSDTYSSRDLRNNKKEHLSSHSYVQLFPIIAKNYDTNYQPKYNFFIKLRRFYRTFTVKRWQPTDNRLHTKA